MFYHALNIPTTTSLLIFHIYFVYSATSTGHWSSEGCTPNLEKSNENKTVCECTHLTNFAVLMSPFSEVCMTSLRSSVWWFDVLLSCCGWRSKEV